MIGTTIGNYRIESKLGEGGMGVVYKAIDINLDRIVALKVLSADLSRDPGLLERFRAEAKAQAHLNHTNIASLYTLLVIDGQTSIVMEYLEGETFDEMLRRRGLIPSEEAVPLFRQALLGIGFAHRMGIVHRDIKPSNIMLNKYGVVKVMDFGIAKVLGGQRLTRTGTQVGTVMYMSPEQIRNRPVNIRSDIYSLGVTLYELITAHLPFESESEFQIMSDHVSTPPPPPTRHYPYIPRGIEQCVLKALEKDPDARFQTVEEFGSALEHPEGIEQWLIAHPARHAPAVQHTGGTPPPLSVPPLGATVFTPTPAPHSATPPAQQYTPPPSHQISPGGPQTPPPGPQTPAPMGRTVVQSAGTGLPAETPPQTSVSRKNFPLIAAAAAVLLIAAGVGAYELFKPSPKPIIGHNTSGGGGTVNSPLGNTSSNTPDVTVSHTNTAPSAASSTAAPNSLSDILPPPETKTASPAKDTKPPETPPVKPPPQRPEQPTATPLEAVQNFAFALNGGRLFRPRTNSAFFWAKQAEQRGYPQGSQLEGTLVATTVAQVQRLRQARNLGAASMLMTQAMEAFPNAPEIQQLNAAAQNDSQNQYAAQQQQQLQAQQQAQAAALARQQVEAQQRAQQIRQQAQQQQQPMVQGARFVVQHRHLAFGDRLNTSFCMGTLSIAPDGLIRYDCLQSQDSRCEHVSFSALDLKQAKMNRQGGLHLATRNMGNWDFYGAQQQLQGAMQAITQAMSGNH